MMEIVKKGIALFIIGFITVLFTSICVSAMTGFGSQKCLRTNMAYYTGAYHACRAIKFLSKEVD